VRVIFQTPNQGKGAALRRGFREAAGEAVIVQDADAELDPGDIPRVAAPVLSGRVAVAYGSRFLGGRGGARGISFLANRILTALTNLLYGSALTDMETCSKCCRADVLRRFSIDSDRYNVEPEMTAKLRRLGYAIEEVPVAYRPRTVSQGKKIGWRDGIEAVWTLVKYRCLPESRIGRGS
jgi:glycosyltransferase involved in cell wall biosynthesis